VIEVMMTDCCASPYQFAPVDEPKEYCHRFANGYHLGPQPDTVYMPEGIMTSRCVMDKQEEQSEYLYTFRNDGGPINENAWEAIPQGWHPNTSQSEDPIRPDFNGVVFGPPDLPMYANRGFRELDHLPWEKPNDPYSYNPGIIPKGQDLNRVVHFDKKKLDAELARKFKESGIFYDAPERKAAADAAAQQRALEINRRVKMENPTLLERSNVDYSNPESIARMQASTMYTNPFYNNMGNPNILLQQQQQQMLPNPYGMNNPFGNMVNPLYAQQSGYPQSGIPNNMYGFGWSYLNPYANEPVPGFIRLTEEEKALGRKPSFRRKVSNNSQVSQSQETLKYTKKQGKGKFKVRVEEVYEIRDDNGNVVEELSVEEYNKREALRKQKKEQEENSVYNKLRKKAYWITGQEFLNTAKLTNTLSETWSNNIKQLVEDMAVYDEARSMVLIISALDSDLDIDSFRKYYNECKIRLNMFRSDEKANDDIDYREPYMFRDTPKKIGTDADGDVYTEYIFPRKEFFTLDDGKVILFRSHQPRGWREPSKEEWQLFIKREIAFRAKAIKIGLLQDMAEDVKKTHEEDTLKHNMEITSPYDFMTIRVNKWKQQTIMMRKQHDFYKNTVGSKMDDSEFEDWWNKRNPKTHMKPSPKERLAQIDSWRRQETIKTICMLEQATPVDYASQANLWAANVHQQIKKFENGAMDNCKSLADVLDALDYLEVRIMEERIAEQRKENLKLLYTDPVATQDALIRAFQNPIPNLGNNIHPDYRYENATGTDGMPLGSIDFMNTEEYINKREKFYERVNSNNKVALRPIYR